MKNCKERNDQSVGNKSGDQPVFAKTQVTQTITSTVRRTRAARSEGSQTRSTEISRHTRVSSRRFSGANKSIELQSSDFTRVNGAGVISTGSLCAPDAYLSAIAKLQESGVLSFDNINVLPSDHDGVERIEDANTFIENLDRWSVQGDVDSQTNQSAPCGCIQSSGEAISDQTLQSHSGQEKIGDVRRESRTARSEKFTIIHSSILSRKAEVSHV